MVGLARCVVRRTRSARRRPSPVSVNGSLCTFAFVGVCRIVAFDSGGGFNGGDYAHVLAPLVPAPPKQLSGLGERAPTTKDFIKVEFCFLFLSLVVALAVRERTTLSRSAAHFLCCRTGRKKWLAFWFALRVDYSPLTNLPPPPALSSSLPVHLPAPIHQES